MIRVAVNGYGVIGRRVADAVAAQEDMQIVGVVKTKPDYKARLAVEKGFKIYASDDKSSEAFRKAGYQVSGVGKDLVKEAEIVVDACPEDVGARNKATYEQLGKKAIFQGGEEHDVAGVSFVAQCDFDQAVGKRYARVVSCNTTGLCRVLNAVDKAYGIQKARVILARRAADPEESSKGPIDAVVLDPVTLPSHHGADVMTVLPHINVVSMAYKVPTTHMHLHSLIVSLKDGGATEDGVKEAFEGTTRLLLFEGKEGFKSTAQVMDYARELKRSRSDLFEVAVWKDSIKIVDGELCLFAGVHQEAIVVPENVDAIRALHGGYSASDSIRTTNKSLGIIK
ncbi:MAG: type II glyceraldehyde-3-phosphate dehydrogenase [Thaumarchaeota archaeon]|nr:type II glyceraldehyde-3-phosphate dehydrogenase [Nitrososphaerota archaeon]